ncbi:MAG TPA: phosphomannomutase [Dehalococcoidia bacterium]|nr:phosphomannomutase [Dehalococcoidia bacterium]
MITFGTDGWRAVIAEDFTFDNVRACAQGVVEYLREVQQTRKPVVIGYDTRFASEDFAAATAEVIAANGIKVYLSSNAVPTPVLSYAIVAYKAAGGVVITASHNPGRWNGFKYKDSSGASAPGDIVEKIQHHANHALSASTIKRIDIETGKKDGLIEFFDPFPAYRDHIAGLIDYKALSRCKLNVVHDAMFGAGIGYFRELFQGGKIDLVELHGERNPAFPGLQPEPIAKNLQELSTLVKKSKADVGIANDGDSDRIGIVDENGVFLNPHQVFALLSLYLLDVRKERGPIVKSLCSTTMIYRLGKLYDVPVYETKVGFKYVAPVMVDKDAMIGGEESGGYGFKGNVPERDGILAGLFFLDLMVKTGKTPSQLVAYLFSKVGEHYYDRIDHHLSGNEGKTLLGRLGPVDVLAGMKVKKLDTQDGFRYMLEDDSWLLLRFSGTEPLVRIYAESDSMQKVNDLLSAGRKLIGV